MTAFMIAPIQDFSKYQGAKYRFVKYRVTPITHYKNTCIKVQVKKHPTILIADAFFTVASI